MIKLSPLLTFYKPMLYMDLGNSKVRLYIHYTIIPMLEFSVYVESKYGEDYYTYGEHMLTSGAYGA